MTMLQSKRPLVPGLLLIGAIIVVALCRTRRRFKNESANFEFPLLGAPAASCRVPAERALARAERAKEEAAARSARYGFEPREGEIARSLFAEAAACARAAGDAALEGVLHTRVERWTSRLETDYRAHRVALAVALERKDWTAVKRDAAWLLRLLADHGGGYVTWLSDLEYRAQKGGP